METPDIPTPSFAYLVQQALSAAVNPERIAAQVQENVDKLVARSIDDAMQRWSGTGKIIQQALEASLQVGSLNLPSYGHVVAGIVERQIQARVAEVVGAKLSKDLEDLLTLAPKRVKLSELVAELLGNDDDPCRCDGPGSVFCRVEWGEYSLVWIRLAKEKPARDYEQDVKLAINLPKRQGEYKAGEVIEGPIFSGSVKGVDLKTDVRFGFGVKPSRDFGRWFGFEQKILSMYACGTIIEIDEDAVVTTRD